MMNHRASANLVLCLCFRWYQTGASTLMWTNRRGSSLLSWSARTGRDVWADDDLLVLIRFPPLFFFSSARHFAVVFVTEVLTPPVSLSGRDIGSNMWFIPGFFYLDISKLFLKKTFWKCEVKAQFIQIIIHTFKHIKFSFSVLKSVLSQ